MTEIDMTLAQDLMAELLGGIHYTSENGSARTARWTCEDGWICGYTTEKITNSRGAKNDGKFAAIAWKPKYKDGKRSGEVILWEIVYFRAFSQRQLAKKRALKMYSDHSPKWAARHGGKP